MTQTKKQKPTPPTNPPKVTVANIEAALIKARGNVSHVARTMKVSRRTIQRRIAESARLQQVRDDARESMIDVAETALYNKIANGNMTAIIFFLKTQGKGRGYIERQEVDHSGQIDIELDWGNDLDLLESDYSGDDDGHSAGEG